MLTASKLFDPCAYNPGIHRCYYCGLDCDDSFPTFEYVKKTFTNRDIVKFPGSCFVCGCCVSSMTTVTTTTLIDGDIKSGRGGAPRTYSWVLSSEGNSAFSKKHLDFARKSLLSPPTPPFSIILADSGKKQIIFRASVNFDRERYVVQLEEEQILVELTSFRQYLDTATIVSAAIGKKALSDPDSFSAYQQFVEYFGDEKILEQWISIHNHPMAKLAAWVCKGKKDARDENIIRARVPKTTGGSDRPEKAKHHARKARGSKADGDQLLLDIT